MSKIGPTIAGSALAAATIAGGVIASPERVPEREPVVVTAAGESPLPMIDTPQQLGETALTTTTLAPAKPSTSAVEVPTILAPAPMTRVINKPVTSTSAPAPSVPQNIDAATAESPLSERQPVRDTDLSVNVERTEKMIKRAQEEGPQLATCNNKELVLKRKADGPDAIETRIPSGTAFARQIDSTLIDSSSTSSSATSYDLVLPRKDPETGALTFIGMDLSQYDVKVVGGTEPRFTESCTVSFENGVPYVSFNSHSNDKLEVGVTPATTTVQ